MLMRLRCKGFGEEISRRVLQSLIDGYRKSAMLHVAAKLGIADLLDNGPRSSGELAQSLGADALSLRRFLRGLVVLGICSEGEDGRFGITKLGTWLQRTKSRSVRGHAINSGATYTAWGNLLHSVMTGETAFTHAFKVGVWDYRKQESALDEAFNEAFLEGSSRIAREILSAYDVSSVRTIADIGGGYGGLLAAILKDSPSLSGILFDQPHVIAKSVARLKDSGLSERCRVVGGDFLAHVADGADLYILKNVLHDWNDAQSERILKNCRHAMHAKAKLLLIERIMPERARKDPLIVMQDLRMLISTGGRERNESEFRALFEAAGLKLTRVIPLPSGLNIIEGVCITNR